MGYYNNQSLDYTGLTEREKEVLALAAEMRTDGVPASRAIHQAINEYENLRDFACQWDAAQAHERAVVEGWGIGIAWKRAARR
jgi:hypothetical protein